MMFESFLMREDTRLTNKVVRSSVEVVRTARGECEVAKFEDEQNPSSPDTLASSETDLFLTAAGSDIGEDSCDSDSSCLPSGFIANNSKTVKVDATSFENAPFQNGRPTANGAVAMADQTSRCSKPALESCTLYPNTKDMSQPACRRTKKSPGKPTQIKQEIVSSGSIPNTKPEMVDSSITLEPSRFSLLHEKMEEPLCDIKANILLEVLKYCQTLSTAMQRLEQKVDALQTSYDRHFPEIDSKNIEKPAPVVHSKVSQVTDHQPPPCNGTDPPIKHHHTWKCLGNVQPSASQAELNCHFDTKPTLLLQAPANPEPLPRGPGVLGTSQHDHKVSLQKPTPRIGGGRGRGRRRGRGGRAKGAGAGGDIDQGWTRGVKRPLEPAGWQAPLDWHEEVKRSGSSAAPADEGQCISQVAKVLSELQERRALAKGSSLHASPEAPKEPTSSEKGDQQILIGSAFRKVWIPYSVYMEAFKQDQPQKAVVPVLHAVFPDHVLACSAVIADPHRGIQELSPSKLEAIREWLAEMYPRHAMEVKGKAWAECLSVINTITRRLKMDTTPSKVFPP